MSLKWMAAVIHYISHINNNSLYNNGRSSSCEKLCRHRDLTKLQLYLQYRLRPPPGPAWLGPFKWPVLGRGWQQLFQSPASIPRACISKKSRRARLCWQPHATGAAAEIAFLIGHEQPFKQIWTWLIIDSYIFFLSSKTIKVSKGAATVFLILLSLPSEQLNNIYLSTLTPVLKKGHSYTVPCILVRYQELLP